MELFDYLGNAHTTSKKSSIDAINAFTSTDLNYLDPDIATLNQALTEDPSCATLLIIHAYLAILIEAPTYSSDAIGFLDRISGKNKREILWEDALRTFLEPGYTYSHEAKKAMLEKTLLIIEQFPSDLVAFRLTVTMCLFTGEKSAMLDAMKSCLKEQKNILFSEFQSICGFIYYENQMLDEAEETCLRAYSMNPHNPWTHHNLCHVYSMKNQYQKALESLLGNEGDWERGTFVKSHNRWHMCVLHIILGQTEAAERTLKELIDINWWHNVHRHDVLGSLLYFDIIERDILEFLTESQVDILKNQKFGSNYLTDVLAVWFLKRVNKEKPVDVINQFPPEIKAFAEAMVLKIDGMDSEAREKLLENHDHLGLIGGSILQNKMVTDFAGDTWRTNSE